MPLLSELVLNMILVLSFNYVSNIRYLIVNSMVLVLTMLALVLTVDSTLARKATFRFLNLEIAISMLALA